MGGKGYQKHTNFGGSPQKHLLYLYTTSFEKYFIGYEYEEYNIFVPIYWKTLWTNQIL